MVRDPTPIRVQDEDVAIVREHDIEAVPGSDPDIVITRVPNRDTMLVETEEAIFDVNPAVGPSYTLLAFVIVITGGLGSMPGALLGGILIGFTEAMAGLIFTPSTKSMFGFAILVLVLLFRPQGILGKKV